MTIKHTPVQLAVICCLLLAFSQGVDAVLRVRQHVDANATDAACPNECSGNGFCHKGACLCKGGFSGEDCSVVDCGDRCVNGVCQPDGSCLCAEGFSGISCAIPACEQDCNQHGLCNSGLCICFPGFSGELCENGAPVWDDDEGLDLDTCPNDCSGHGICTSGECFCNSNFYGVDCSEVVCPNECSNHGTCDVNLGICVCDEQHSGEACEFLSCPYNCTGSLYGSCDTGTGECQCKDEYAGFKGCNPAECKDDCNSATEQGTCKVGSSPQVKGQCECAEGWEGEACEIRKCDADHTGRNCDIPRCPWDCNGPEHGVCGGVENGFKCECLAGWSGDSCNLIDCPYECLNNGTCDRLTGKCDCTTSPFGGEQCTEGCPVEDCSGNGVCVGGQCFCHPGYFGEGCETVDKGVHKTPAVAHIPCEHGVVTDGICECDKFWTGAACSVALDTLFL